MNNKIISEFGVCGMCSSVFIFSAMHTIERIVYMNVFFFNSTQKNPNKTIEFEFINVRTIFLYISYFPF